MLFQEGRDAQVAALREAIGHAIFVAGMGLDMGPDVAVLWLYTKLALQELPAVLVGIEGGGFSTFALLLVGRHATPDGEPSE